MVIKLQNCQLLSKLSIVVKVVNCCLSLPIIVKFIKNVNLSEIVNMSKLLKMALNVLFQPVAGHMFQSMACHMFQNQKCDSVSQWQCHLLSCQTLVWTAKNIKKKKTEKIDFLPKMSLTVFSRMSLSISISIFSRMA